MRKATLLAIALLFVAGTASAEFTGHYIGLFTGEDHSYWCVDGVGFYPAEVWIMSKPGPNGIICNEFSICYPPNAIQSTVTWNTPIISVTLGDLPSGLSVCYIVCQYDWFWIAHQAIWVTDPTQTFLAVCPHPDIGIYQVADCTPGYPTVECWGISDFYLNFGPEECPAIGTEDTSWGAIKQMIH